MHSSFLPTPSLLLPYCSSKGVKQDGNEIYLTPNRSIPPELKTFEMVFGTLWSEPSSL